jgi:RimJ/RimL family protein N-acetyltransferase
MTAPVIETERLRLRGHCAADFNNSVGLWSDPRVVRFIGGKPNTREECWMRLLRHAGNWALMGYGSWVVEEKHSGAFAGEIGFMSLKREIAPVIEGFPEVGWVIAPSFHGKGYATEAMRAALGWGDAHIAAARTICIIAPQNAPSLGVAAKCGFREFARTQYKGDATAMLERLARVK